jgi:hypothetical protein
MPKRLTDEQPTMIRLTAWAPAESDQVNVLRGLDKLQALVGADLDDQSRRSCASDCLRRDDCIAEGKKAARRGDTCPRINKILQILASEKRRQAETLALGIGAGAIALVRPFLAPSFWAGGTNIK